MGIRAWFRPVALLVGLEIVDGGLGDGGTLDLIREGFFNSVLPFLYN